MNRFGNTKGEIQVKKEEGDFRDDLGGFWVGLGIRHPTHPYLEKFSQKKTDFFGTFNKKGLNFAATLNPFIPSIK